LKRVETVYIWFLLPTASGCFPSTKKLPSKMKIEGWFTPSSELVYQITAGGKGKSSQPATWSSQLLYCLNPPVFAPVEVNILPRRWFGGGTVAVPLTAGQVTKW